MSDKSRRRIPDRIEDIRAAIANIRSDIGDQDKNVFLSDGKTQRAVIESLIVIGEAATRILQAEPNLELAQPEVWQRLRDANGMRNILAHEYFRVDPAVIWDTTINELSDLEASLHHLDIA